MWLPTPSRSAPAGYGLALVIFAGASMLRAMLQNTLGFTVPYMTFFLGVALTSWCAGWGPGLSVAG